MNLQYLPHIQAMARVILDSRPPPDDDHWPGIPWRCNSHGENHIHSQRISGEFFRLMRIHITIATAAQLVPVVQQPTVAIAFVHRGYASGWLSGVNEMLQFRAGYYYTPLLLPGANQESIIELEAGSYEVTVILIEKKYETIFLTLFPELASAAEHILSHNQSGLPYPPQPITPAISKLLQTITRDKDPTESFDFKIGLTVSALILALHQHQKERPATNAEAYQIHTHLICRLRESLTAADVASALNMTPKKVHGLVKQHFHKTFKEYVTGLRMEAAREQLIGSNQSLDDIAIELGYKSIAHFSNAFLKHEGMRPSLYRKKKK